MLLIIVISTIVSLLAITYRELTCKQRRSRLLSELETLQNHTEKTNKVNAKLNEELNNKLIMLSNSSIFTTKLEQKLKEIKTDSTEIRKVVSELKWHNNNQVLENIENQYLGLHGDFVKKLSKRYPNLNTNNIKLCLYIKLNLSNKEIAELRYVDPNSIKVARSRLRKKMGLKSGAQLTTLLHTI